MGLSLLNERNMAKNYESKVPIVEVGDTHFKMSTMWACLTEGFLSVLLLHNLFRATSWQNAKTIVCTLWAMAASCGTRFFFFFLTENIALLFYSCQATFQVFNISQISLANKNIVYQDAWRRKSVSFCIKIKKNHSYISFFF